MRHPVHKTTYIHINNLVHEKENNETASSADYLT
jgi:hypothetical protein